MYHLSCEALDTYDAINWVTGLATPLSGPDRPEHHCCDDPIKTVAYTPTTPVWVVTNEHRLLESQWAKSIVALLSRASRPVPTTSPTPRGSGWERLNAQPAGIQCTSP